MTAAHRLAVANRGKSLSERLWSRVVTRGECRVWTGATEKYGYGLIKRGGGLPGNVLVHRAADELAKGPIPADMEIDHLCSVRRCCRVEHLEPVTHAENMRRMAANRLKRALSKAGTLYQGKALANQSPALSEQKFAQRGGGR